MNMILEIISSFLWLHDNNRLPLFECDKELDFFLKDWLSQDQVNLSEDEYQTLFDIISNINIEEAK